MNFLASWHQRVRPPRRSDSAYRKLTVALVADELTRNCFEEECRVINLAPEGGAQALQRYRPDLLFVESAWAGHRDAWKYRIASYPDHPQRTNSALAALVARARELDIPAVFWNREDGVHFERFISSASLFDTIFTVDVNCIQRYQKAVGREAFVAPLMFAVEPAFHFYSGLDGRISRANFIGSYSWHVHDLRRERQDMLLGTAAAELGLAIFDRNSDRRHDQYRYPSFPNTTSNKKVAYACTGDIYKRHLVSLNVNTIEDSGTMFSRRLVEIIACGGLAVTTPSRSVDRWFRDYCHVVSSADEASALFERLRREGYSAGEREMMAAGAEYVAKDHTWTQRIATILDAIGRVRR